ncbi:putative signal peptide transmembrane protein [Burkholderia sp. H160]|nr:putative signal peptide transmembrane protein [Burkholderia sp. H160]
MLYCVAFCLACLHERPWHFLEKFMKQRMSARSHRLRRRLPMSALLVAVALLSVPAVHAQNDARPPPLDPASAVKPPGTPVAQVGKLTLDQQVKWLRAAQQSRALEKLDDTQLVALFESLNPLTLPRYIKEGPNDYPSYEFTMSRSERIHGQWPDKPDHMLVRVAHDPLRIYAKWLPDGAHAGQEIIYDESKRSDEMYGHLGGIMNVMPLWTSLTGVLARSQSNHNVRDLGTRYVADQYLIEGRKYTEAGLPRSTKIAVKTIDGVRVVAFTFETPVGQPQFYAKKETLGLDLRHPFFRSVESYDNDGKIFERIVFEHITPATFDDATFDPNNKAYKF